MHTVNASHWKTACNMRRKGFVFRRSCVSSLLSFWRDYFGITDSSCFHGFTSVVFQCPWFYSGACGFNSDGFVCSIVHQDEKKYIVRIGSLVIHNIGQLLPHQLQSGKFHNIHHLYPVSTPESTPFSPCAWEVSHILQHMWSCHCYQLRLFESGYRSKMANSKELISCSVLNGGMSVHNDLRLLAGVLRTCL